MLRKIIAIFLLALLSGGLIYGGNIAIKKFLSKPEKYAEELAQQIKEEKIPLPTQTPQVLGEQIERRLQELQATRVWQRNLTVLSPLNQDWAVVIGQADTNPDFKLQVQGNVGPADNNQFNLGSQENQWAGIYGQNIFQDGEQVVSNVSATGGISASISGSTLNLGTNFAAGGCLGLDSSGNLQVLEDCLDFDKFKDKMNLDADTDINFADSDLTFSASGKHYHRFSAEGDVYLDEPDATFFLDAQNNRVGIGTLTPLYPLDVTGDIRSTTQILAPKFTDLDDQNFYLDPSDSSYLKDLYADVLYDRNNTAYKLDPASTSYLNDVRANIFYDRQNTSFYLDPNQTSRLFDLIILNMLTVDKIQSSGSILDINNGVLYVDKTNKRVGINTTSPAYYDLYVNGIAFASTEMRAPFFRDSNNTAYYVDPASTSYLNDLRTNILYDRQNTSYYLDPASTSKLNDLIINGTSTFNNNITVNGNITGDSFIDRNNTVYKVDPASTSYLNDLRANIIYDRQNTAYYLDPASDSNLNNLTITGTTTTDKIQSSGSALDVNNGVLYVDKTNKRVGINTTSPAYFDLFVNGIAFASTEMRAPFFRDSNNTAYYVDPASTSYLNDLRTNILYDRQNTSYYLDPASTSKLNELKAKKFIDDDNNNYYLDPASESRIYRLRIDTTLYGDYIVPHPSASNKKLGVDTMRWDDLYVKEDSIHIGTSETDEGKISYDTTNNILNISTDNTTKGDIALNTDMLYLDRANKRVGVHTTNPIYDFHVEGIAFASTEMRAPFFRDSNNTAYYVDPASTSYLNDLRTNILYDRQNTSYYLDPASKSNLNEVQAKKFIDSDNTSYLLDPAGASALYDLSVANTLSAPALIDKNNPFYFVDPASTSYLNDLRANIFYDRQNTAYYLDPASTSNLATLLSNNLQTGSFTLTGTSMTFLSSSTTNITTSGDLAINTNQLFFDKSTQRVGIGTTTPTATVDIWGDAKVNFDFYAPAFYDLDDPTNYYVDPDNTSYLLELFVNSQLDVEGDLLIGDEDIIFYSFVGTNFSVYGIFSINTDQLVVDPDSENVGIGTTTPTEKLTVQGDILGTDGVNNKYLLMGGDSTSTGGQLKLYDDTGTLQVWLRTTGDSYVNYGKFSVATKTPTHTFQVGQAGDGTSAIANAWNTFSDKRFKENIQPLDNALDKILQLEGVSFSWKNTKKPTLGFIAQDVQTIVPEIVYKGSDGYLSLDYTKLTPLLVEAVKEQQSLIDQNTGRINNLDLSVFGKLQKIDFETEKKHSENKNALLKIFSIKDQAVELMRKLVVKTKAVFEAPVRFLSKVVFTGRVEYQDKDLAGYARISRGSSQVRVVFERPFSFTPVITASALNTPVQFFLKDISSAGFTIAISSAADKDYEFSWVAMPVRGAKRSVSTPDNTQDQTPTDNAAEETTNPADKNQTNPDQTNSNQPTPTPTPQTQQQITPTPDQQNNTSATSAASTQENQNNSDQPEPDTSPTSTPTPTTTPTPEPTQKQDQPDQPTPTETQPESTSAANTDN